MEITSIHNTRVKQARALLRSGRERRRLGRVLIEGRRFIAEAAGAGACIRYCFYAEELRTAEDSRLLAELEGKGSELLPVTREVLCGLSDTLTPQGLVAVAEAPAQMGAAVLAAGHMILVVDAIRDPGNLGTMLRTAAAVGAGAILLVGTTDPTSPKVMRGSAGACYSVPMWMQAEHHTVVSHLRASGYRIVVCDARGHRPYYSTALQGLMAVVIGNEAHGPHPVWQDVAADVVHLPMPGRAESLNAGVAAAVVLYEALRQRDVGC